MDLSNPMSSSKRQDGFTVAYVITSNGRDVFADMAVLSMLSLRMTNPDLRIVALCDLQSATALRRTKHRMLECCDEMVPVETPDGKEVFRNRWIKTRLPLLIKDHFLYLDSDTLVRRRLAECSALVDEFGAVASYNEITVAEQIWEGERKILVDMGWERPFRAFLNGGVFFVKQNEGSRRFFAMWHRLWLDGMETKSHWRDQASLNCAVIDSGVRLTILPSAYNASVVAGEPECVATLRDAAIWHFYPSERVGETAFAALLNTESKHRHHQLRENLAQVLAMPAPWPNRGPVARQLAARVARRGYWTTTEWLWLKNRRLAAVRFGLSTLLKEWIKG